MISIVDTNKLNALNENETLQLAQNLEKNNKELMPEQMLALANNLGENVTLDQVSLLANEISLKLIENTNPMKLGDSIAKMKIDNLDENRKIFIGTIVTKNFLII